MREEDFVTALRKCGARVFIVGGWIRDQLRGVKAHDKDYMVAGIEEKTFVELFPAAERVGKSFCTGAGTGSQHQLHDRGNKERRNPSQHRRFF